MFDLSAQAQSEAHDQMRALTRCQIAGALSAASSARVLAAIEAVPRWTLVTRLGGRHLDLDAAAMRSEERR